MFEKLINFEKMITPSIIKIIFWIGVAASVLGGLVVMFSGGPMVFAGLIIIVFGTLSTRVYCEILILFFKINDNLGEIKEKLCDKDKE